MIKKILVRLGIITIAGKLATFQKLADELYDIADIKRELAQDKRLKADKLKAKAKAARSDAYEHEKVAGAAIERAQKIELIFG